MKRGRSAIQVQPDKCSCDSTICFKGKMWFTEFRWVCRSTRDVERSGCPNEVATIETIEKIHHMVVYLGFKVGSIYRQDGCHVCWKLITNAIELQLQMSVFLCSTANLTRLTPSHNHRPWIHHKFPETKKQLNSGLLWVNQHRRSNTDRSLSSLYNPWCTLYQLLKQFKDDLKKNSIIYLE